MRSLKLLFLLLSGLALSGNLPAQGSGGQLSGNLQAQGNFFIRDSLIGAAGTPQYDRQKYGADAWLNLTYSNWGFVFGLRFDLFNNSNLLNPLGSYTDQGIGRWYVQKTVNKLGISAGYLYDQIGSGIIFRTFEERPLLIDNALVGARLTYDLPGEWTAKVFTGRQKQQFDFYDAIIKGLSLEGFLSSPEGATAPITLAPGFGIVSRTLDDNSMNAVVATLNTYSREDAFVPQYNTYAFTFYNTLTTGNVSWYVETAFKTKDILNDPFGEFDRDTAIITGDKLINKAGSVFYSSISYAQKGLGITLEAKRTQYFDFRTRPQEQLNRGLITFLPPMTRINTYRLTSRYNAATQFLGELALQGDIRFSPSRKWSFNVNYANISDLDDELLYREIFTEISHKQRSWSILGGVQMQKYNQEVYEFRPGAPVVETVTPYVDFLYKFDRRKALRLEAQYMHTGEDPNTGFRQDYGNWLFGLAEFSIAPHWTFTVSDMYNIEPGTNSPIDESGKKQSLHYPRLDVFYTEGPNRFSISYVKQVEGVVCTGGICRLEPAFSGVKVSVLSAF